MRCVAQVGLQVRDGDRAAVEHARGQRAIDAARSAKTSAKCSSVPAPPEAISGTLADSAHGRELREVVALAHAVAGHAVEHDLAGAAVLHLAHPVERARPRVAACGPDRR